MIELGQLERRHEDFARRNTVVVVVSMEGTDDAQKTQAEFPHLLVIADQGRGLSDAARPVPAPPAPAGRAARRPPTTLALPPSRGPRGTFPPSPFEVSGMPRRVVSVLLVALGSVALGWQAETAQAQQGTAVQWIWFDEGAPLTNAPVATRYFRRTFDVG